MSSGNSRLLYVIDSVRIYVVLPEELKPEVCAGKQVRLINIFMELGTNIFVISCFVHAQIFHRKNNIQIYTNLRKFLNFNGLKKITLLLNKVCIVEAFYRSIVYHFLCLKCALIFFEQNFVIFAVFEFEILIRFDIFIVSESDYLNFQKVDISTPPSPRK